MGRWAGLVIYSYIKPEILLNFLFKRIIGLAKLYICKCLKLSRISVNWLRRFRLQMWTFYEPVLVIKVILWTPELPCCKKPIRLWKKCFIPLNLGDLYTYIMQSFAWVAQQVSLVWTTDVWTGSSSAVRLSYTIICWFLCHFVFICFRKH